MNYKKYLTDNILPFWLDNAIDKEKGGIFYSLDKNGNNDCKDKNIWFSGRALWSFANAYNTVDKKTEYLNTCKSIYDFIKGCILPDGRLPFLTDSSGNAKEQKKLFHGEAHAAMGCAAYYKACNDENVKTDALKFFSTAYNMYMSDEARKESCPGGKERYIFGRDMLALSIAQTMRAGGISDKRIEILAKKSLDNIINTGYVDDISKTVNEYAGFNGEVYDYSCYGHLYEAAWFILYEGEIKKDNKIKELGKKILDYCLTRNKNQKFGAIPLDSKFPNNEFLWWPQCEAVIAYYVAYSIFKDEFYIECAKQTEDFAFKTFGDNNGKEWFSKCDSKGNIIDDSKGSLIKGVFHLPRMLMILEVLQKNGNITEWM